MLQRPGTFAIRAVNQYRRRDVLPYLGLRYYLENSAARTDHWARDVAVDLVQHRVAPGYLKIQHFKDVDERGAISHREMLLPGPNEALAEAVLINECAQAGGAFALSDKVFSYIPAQGNDLSGIFNHYMHGLKSRHEAISVVCRTQPKAIVQFFDIKRFYPSIKTSTALQIWIEACNKSNLNPRFRSLGEKLLHDHGEANLKEHGKLLTGPMFSHLIGNLVLASTDEELLKAPARYFRYVDDVVFVGTPEQVRDSAVILKGLLGDIELELHDERSPKSLQISSLEWLEGERDFSESKNNVSWMTLVGDLKRLLLWYPNLADEMQSAFMSEGFRMPLPDYSGAVRNHGFVARSLGLIQRPWFRKALGDISPSTVLNQARILRSQYDSELEQLLDGLSSAKGFTAKRMLPKARYRIGRLSYLAEPDRLNALSNAVSTVPALYFQSEVARAIGTGSIDQVIALGTNAAQAVAQPLRMANKVVQLSRVTKSEAEIQSLAVMVMNGVHIEMPTFTPTKHELYQIASQGVNEDLMLSSDGFIRELACLHGLSNVPRHANLLDTAFDEAEVIALDAIEQARSSLSM